MRLNRYSIAVLMAGFCWGFMGVFTRNLAKFGLGTTDAIIIRCGIAALCFGLLILIKNPSDFKIKPKDMWCFIGTGLVSLLFFTFCYFSAIKLMSLSSAAILLYTAPTIVMILSALFFKERITRRKLFAIFLAFAGCCLVSGIAEGNLSFSVKGLLFGLGSGFGYALYTIFSRFAIDRGYSSNVINFYSCLLSFIGAILLWGNANIISDMQASFLSVSWCLGLGLITCFLPYTLYTYSLTGLENGKASVMASLEPVVASIAGVVIYRESVSLPSFIGIALVLLAVFLLSKK